MFFYFVKKEAWWIPPMERKPGDLASLIPIHCSLSGSCVLGMGWPALSLLTTLLTLTPAPAFHITVKLEKGKLSLREASLLPLLLEAHGRIRKAK